MAIVSSHMKASMFLGKIWLHFVCYFCANSSLALAIYLPSLVEDSGHVQQVHRQSAHR